MSIIIIIIIIITIIIPIIIIIYWPLTIPEQQSCHDTDHQQYLLIWNCHDTDHQQYLKLIVEIQHDTDDQQLPATIELTWHWLATHFS